MPPAPRHRRTVHLPPVLVDLLTEHRDAHPEAKFVSTEANGTPHRRANFRQGSGRLGVETSVQRRAVVAVREATNGDQFCRSSAVNERCSVSWAKCASRV